MVQPYYRVQSTDTKKNEVVKCNLWKDGRDMQVKCK